jgi:hypothetical protein
MHEAVRMQPGDRVLLILDNDTLPFMEETLTAGLEAAFPGVQFQFVHGVRSALVFSDGVTTR